MTEATRTSGLAVILGTQHPAQRRKESVLDPTAFLAAVQEEGKSTDAPNPLRPEETAGEDRAYRVAGLTEKFLLPRQQGAITKHRERVDAGIEKDARSLIEGQLAGAQSAKELADARSEESGQDIAAVGANTDQPRAEEIPKNVAVTAPVASKHTDVDKLQATGGAGEPASTQGDVRSEAPARSVLSSAQGAADEMPAHSNAGRTASALPADAGLDNSSRFENRTAYTSSVAQDARVLQSRAMSAQNGSSGDKPFSGGERQDADGGKPAFQVLSRSAVAAPSQVSLTGASPTGAALVASLEAAPSFASAATEAAKAMAAGAQQGNRTLHSLKLQLQPAELGTVVARLTISNDQLSVELQVETSEARQKLNADGDAITRALRMHGYDIDRVTIQQTSTGANASANGSTSDRESSYQRSAGDGQPGGGSSGSRRGEEGGRQFADTEGANKGGRDAGTNRGLYI